jgi:Immunity protein 50
VATDDYPTPVYIRGHEKVVDTYGYWPSFHDSPVLSLEHDEAGSTADLVVEVFEAGRAEGSLVNRHSIVLRLFGVTTVNFRQFRLPNTILEMTFDPVSAMKGRGRFNVGLVSVTGGDCTAGFVAESGEVVSITACDDRS